MTIEQPDEQNPLTQVPKKVSRPATDRVLSNWTIAFGVIFMLGVAAISSWLLLAHFSGPGDGPRLEALRLAATFVVGTGGSFALWLATRRQRSTELGLKEQARIATENAADRAKDLAQREKSADDIRRDAIERRITELYTKAADQLGSDKAPVRLAGLYALERLAQGNEEHRQTIVNLICAYLRMPPPATSSSEEWEVRLTAQTVLASHLRCTTTEPPATFWEGIDIDLSRSKLMNFDFSYCRITKANFSYAHMCGGATFWHAVFVGDAKFTGALFEGAARMSQSHFQWHADFCEAVFKEEALFTFCAFDGDIEFNGAHFDGGVAFSGSTMAGTYFPGAKFGSTIAFDRTRISGPVQFVKATIGDRLIIRETPFPPGTDFREATISPQARETVMALLPDGYRIEQHENRLVVKKSK